MNKHYIVLVAKTSDELENVEIEINHTLMLENFGGFLRRDDEVWVAPADMTEKEVAIDAGLIAFVSRLFNDASSIFSEAGTNAPAQERD